VLTIKHVLRSTLILTERHETELVVVDGCSTDGTFNVVDSFVSENRSRYASVKILKDPGTSLSLARHIGFKNSKGDIVIFLDGDTPLTISFKHYIDKELEGADLISPMFKCIPLDKATKTFSEFIKVVSYIQLDASKHKGFSDPALLPPARIFKRAVLERMRGYPVSSRFFGEDRVATALAIKYGFRYKFSPRLTLLKIDDPGYYLYWKKHFRYALGIHKDISPLGKNTLKSYIIPRRLSYINIIFPILSLSYAWKAYLSTRNVKTSIGVMLIKHMLDIAMLVGDLIGLLYA